MRRIMPLLVLAVTPHLLAAQQAPDSTPSAAAWNERSIIWPPADTDGTKFVFLEGRNDVPGRTFSYAYFMPAGHWEHHWHSGEVRVFVMSGALRVSYGDQLDSATARTYRAGSFLYVPAGKPHTMGANVNTIIIGIATGPWKTQYGHAPSSEHQHH
jgi:quercetin dioxygenase-like cupin family protein